MLKEKIENKLNEYIEGTDLFVVDIKITPQQKVMVFLDGIKNISIDKCVAISRMLESYLEEEQLVKENYLLEVSSPGMGQPFKVHQQYLKSINKSLEVLRKDGEKYKGVLKEVDDAGVSLEIEKKKKGKVISRNLIDIAFEDIKATKQLITFK